MNNRINLLNFDREGLKAFFASIGEKAYRAEQILKWIHFNGKLDFAEMTNVSKALRTRLAEITDCHLPTVLHEKKAADGVHKWILKLSDGNCIETVFIPEKNRGTLCISSQVGCILDCKFCSTGKQGFNRNLTTAEIIAQLWIAVRTLSHTHGEHDHQVTNVVMMGMGEPLLNLDNLLPALNLMMDDFAYGLSKRRVTVSTAGVVPAMYELRTKTDVALAVSLHAPNDVLRNQIVPINKKYPLGKLMQACRDYFKADKRRSITIEYVMLNDVNDRMQDADALIKLLSGIRVKVNLIPFNPFPHAGFTRSPNEVILAFQARLLRAGLNTTIRRTRGDEIDGACGQLVGQVNDKTQRSKKHKLAIQQSAMMQEGGE